MKKLLSFIIIILSFPADSICQKIVKHPDFDNLITIDSSIIPNKSLLQINCRTQSDKIKLIETINKKTGSKPYSSKKLIWSENHKYYRQLSLDTFSTSKLEIIYQINTPISVKDSILRDFTTSIKSTITNWKPRNVNQQAVFFVGHRGGLINSYQENTKLNLRQSKSEGIAFIEVDVVITSKNVPFIGHDWKYLREELNISKHQDSIDIMKSSYSDGQKITPLSDVLDAHNYLILDLVHNSLSEQKRIINYLYKNYRNKIKKSVYIQIDKYATLNYINKIDSEISVSFNYRAANTGNWKKGWIHRAKENCKGIKMFVVNPSMKITEEFLEHFGKNNKNIIPVVKADDFSEIQRMTLLGFKYIMINDIRDVENKIFKNQ